MNCRVGIVSTSYGGWQIIFFQSPFHEIFAWKLLFFLNIYFQNALISCASSRSPCFIYCQNITIWYFITFTLISRAMLSKTSRFISITLKFATLTHHCNKHIQSGRKTPKRDLCATKVLTAIFLVFRNQYTLQWPRKKVSMNCSWAKVFRAL